MMTLEERREKARLRSERWRRAWDHAEASGATAIDHCDRHSMAVSSSVQSRQ